MAVAGGPARRDTPSTTGHAVPAAAPGTTISGRELPPVAAGPARELEAPGEYPYTRGIHPQMYRSRLWTMRMFAGFGSPEDTNARFRRLLEQGQTGLSTAFDMPSLMGYDPDHPLSRGRGRARGRLGGPRRRHGPPVRRHRPRGGLDVDDDLRPGAGGPGAVRGGGRATRACPARELRGTLQTDILKEFIAQKEWVVPERPSMRLVAT